MDANLAKASHLAQDTAVGPQLYRLLRDRIIRGDMQPGSRISKTEIAVAYSVSRQPVREAVEADIERRVAERANAATLRVLDARIGDQIALSTDAPSEEFMRLDEEFHRARADLAGQAAVADRLGEMKIHMNRVRHISARQLSRERLVAQHAAVVEAIRTRAPQRAEAGIRAHLHEIVVDLPDIVARYPAFFAGHESLEAMP